MKKPQPRTEVAITTICPHFYTVYFYATADAATEFAKFGSVEPWVKEEEYQITVDPRFSFDEVVDYIRCYGEEKDETTSL